LFWCCAVLFGLKNQEFGKVVVRAAIRSAQLTPNCFIVRDHDGQRLAYIYFEDEPGRQAAAKLLTKDDARRIAANIAKLPELLPRKT
jgi:hypothetical protein